MTARVIAKLVEERDFLAFRIARLDPPKIREYRHRAEYRCPDCAWARANRRTPGTYRLAFMLHRQAAALREARLALLERVLARLAPVRRLRRVA